MFGKKKEIETSLNLNERIELTLLDPRAIDKDIHTLINIAVKNGYYGVCVNPSWVSEARAYVDEKIHSPVTIVSVIGFPLGVSTLNTKIQESKEALKNGADELDLVINIGKVKEGNYAYVKNELSRIVRMARGKIVKAIIETCYLTREEIKLVCKACIKAKIDFVKTSTGYGTGGATVDDVCLLKEILGGRCGIKASGGIRTRLQAEELVRAGADRIGTSKVI